MTIRIALAQVTSTEDATGNLATIDRYTSRAAADGARLVVFPEAMMRCFGGAPLVEIAQPLDGSWANAVRAIAERADITVVTGMFTPTEDGRVRNTLLVNAGGVLITPKLPDIDGVDSFAGVTMHTARWDHAEDLTGKRVAIIGTGASAVQVIPEIAPIVRHLTVFQRTPIWCFPKFDVPLPRAARVAMRIPGGKAVQRLLSQAYVELTFPLAAQYFTVNPMAKNMSKVGESYLRKQVDDPEVRDKLTPRYAVGCKRPGFHNTYLSTFNRDNVRLVTEPIDKITGSGVGTNERRDPRCRRADPGDRVQGDGHRRPSDLSGHRARRPVVERVLG